jgi:hypothetical protein
MTVLGLDSNYANEKIVTGFPDMMGMTDSQIAALPRYVQYFKCEGKTESGDPGCDDNKFNETLCTERAGKASWHPGWKYHALEGHWLAATVVEVVVDSLQELVKLEPTTTETLEQRYSRLEYQLKELNADEQTDYENIFDTPVPEFLQGKFNEHLWRKDEDKEAMQDMPLSMFIKAPSFCHTAMLPAEIRFKGLLTENPDMVGDIVRQNYEFGVYQSEIAALERDGDGVSTNSRPGHKKEMVIAMNNGEHQVCPEPLNADFKDYFLVTSKEPRRSQVFPNAAELAYYTEFDPEKAQGWIFICMKRCKCSIGCPADEACGN